MTAYILNENVSAGELKSIREVASGFKVDMWPTDGVDVPSDIFVAILIIREFSSEIEEGRAVGVVNLGVRIVCIYIEEVDNISVLANMFCSTKLGLNSGELGDALKGSDATQQDAKGNEAPISKRKRHNCN